MKVATPLEQTKPVVVVAASDGKSLIQMSKNPEFGWITVQQERVIFDETGFIRPVEVKAFIQGKPAALKALGWTIGMVVSGQIIIKESMTPFSFKSPEKDFKVAGATGIVCCVDDQPIYRRTVFTRDMNREDTFIPHDNGRDIRIRHLEILDEESRTDTPVEQMDLAMLPA